MQSDLVRRSDATGSVRSALCSPPRLRQHVAMSASRDAQPPSPGDGGAAVVTPPGGRIRRTVRLAGALSSCSLARRVLREVMVQHGFEACLDAAELACTELVSNVVLHAHTDLELTVEVDRTAVRVEVRDFSPVLPVQRSYDSQATTGRGLALVAVLTTDHGITDAGPGGKTAWFSISPDSLDEQSPADLLEAWADADWDMPDPAPLPQVPGVQVREVSLLALPSALWLAARQHHDALVRELVLHLAEHSDQVAHVDVPATDLARALLSAAVAAAVEKIPTADRSAADAAGAGLAVPRPLDLVLQVPEALGPAFACHAGHPRRGRATRPGRPAAGAPRPAGDRRGTGLGLRTGHRSAERGRAVALAGHSTGTLHTRGAGSGEGPTADR